MEIRSLNVLRRFGAARGILLDGIPYISETIKAMSQQKNRRKNTTTFKRALVAIPIRKITEI
jgi:hypothetical protein